jgi:hypothetical protein
MKKFIFTAIAMEAFSGVSMAGINGIVPIAKIQKFELNLTKKKLPTQRRIQCESFKFNWYVNSISAGFSPEAASQISYPDYFKCMTPSIIS